MRLWCTLWVVLLAIVSGCNRADTDRPERPNILLVISDDQSASHAGAYGNSVIQTPNLDRFAEQGMRFDRAYVTSSQCSPSRASIFTGLFPQRIHMTRLHTPLPPEYRTFPEMLQALGYHTGICGRHNHMEGYAFPGTPIDSVFERNDMRTMAERVDVLMDTTFNRHVVVRQVEEFLDTRPADKPFFLQAAFHEPHRKWKRGGIPSPHDPDSVVVPFDLPDLPEVRREIADYYDAVAQMDDSFGDIMAVLDDRGLERSTVVVFLGDNGYAMPRGKMTLYQAGIHVPLIIRWQGVAEANSSTEALVSTIDLAATFLDLAGGSQPENWEGFSLRRLLNGASRTGHEYVFATRGQHDTFDLQRCVTSGRYTLIYNALHDRPYRIAQSRRPFAQVIDSLHSAGELEAPFERLYYADRRPEFELYDLVNDPAQLHNLAGNPSHARIESELRQQLAAWMERNYDYLPPVW